jgi:hypothetical protein
MGEYNRSLRELFDDVVHLTKFGIGRREISNKMSVRTGMVNRLDRKRLSDLRSVAVSSQCPREVVRKRCRTPIFLDVFHDQIRALLMAYVGRVSRIVHRIRQIPQQHTAHAPLCHLLYGERAIQNAHVGVDASVEHCLDAARTQEIVDFLPVV